MNFIADEYENWFQLGNRDLAQFLSQRESKGEPLSDDQFRDCVLTDQYLRHQIKQPLDVSDYTRQFARVANDHELQVELCLEAFGYLEEKAIQELPAGERQKHLTQKDREDFLARLPESVRFAIADEVLAGSTIAPSKPDLPRSSASGTEAIETRPKIPRYRIDEEIGHGSFGIVYRGWDTQLERAVAVKVLRSQQSSESLFSEARLVASLESPGIIPVYDCGIEEGGRAFLVTAFIEGLDLREWLENVDRNDRTRICRLFVRLCQSLDRAHQAGIVHRDIKPTNIIVQADNQPMLLDFGLATRNWQPGKKGELVGTPAYMSPEQARGEGHLVDARSDIFSVGILLLESLAGQLPWASRSSKEMIREIAHGHVRAARHFDGLIPIELERICKKATSAAMSARYNTAADLAAELEWFIDESTKSDSQRSSQQHSKLIGPRGLQPYTHADAESFWQLLPGERNGKGQPDSVAWWLGQLQSDVHNQTGIVRNVLVLYGPSGSGKSSLLSAGVLPFIDSTQTRYVEIDASEFIDTKPLARQLAAWMPLLQSDKAPLADQLAEIRENESRRTVIVFDQFEQVFKAGFEKQRNELYRAMRQADGQRLQFVLVVRDEFWSAISQWMRRLDSPLRDGRNAMALEKFSRHHAMDVM